MSEMDARYETAGRALEQAKKKCTEACVDEAVHAKHRDALEAAYHEYHAASAAVVESLPPPDADAVEQVPSPVTLTT